MLKIGKKKHVKIFFPLFRRVVIHHENDMPTDYGTTPGGTIFGTTPGGEETFKYNI